ncbi:MAG: YodC family protein [Hyphomonadaceae bacterium]
MAEMFKCGDRVQVKSGGPTMAVTGVSPDRHGVEMVWCAWFNDAHVHQTAGYPAGELKAVEIAELGAPP